MEMSEEFGTTTIEPSMPIIINYETGTSATNRVVVNSISNYSSNNIVDEPIIESGSCLCKICLVNKVCIVLSTCGHVFCSSCTLKFKEKCANCRKPFKPNNKIRMFF
jgi:C3HC4-type zinc finger (RING finger) protein